MIVSTIGAREFKSHFGGGAKLAVREDDRAQVVEIFEAGDGALLGDLEGRVEHLAVLDLEEAVDELLGVADAGLREGGGIDELDQVVELERAVLRRGRGEQDDAGAAGLTADRGGAEVELPRAVAALAAAAHELRHAVLAGLRLVEVFEGRGLVDDEHVDADLVPRDAGVVLPVGRQREDLLDPRAHAVLEQRPLALRQILLIPGALHLLLEGPLAQGDRARDGLDLLDVGEHLLLVHLGPRHRVEAEDHDVDLAALQKGPLLGPLLRRVGVGGDDALAGAAADLLALRADHDDAVVRQRAQDVVVPLPHQRARHEDHRAADPALLARARR